MSIPNNNYQKQINVINSSNIPSSNILNDIPITNSITISNNTNSYNNSGTNNNIIDPNKNSQFGRVNNTQPLRAPYSPNNIPIMKRNQRSISPQVFQYNNNFISNQPNLINAIQYNPGNIIYNNNRNNQNSTQNIQNQIIKNRTNNLITKNNERNFNPSQIRLKTQTFNINNSPYNGFI